MSNTGEEPLARSTDLITEELGDEVLVYDTNANRGHSLSPDAAKVWRCCDGRTSAEELSAKLGVDAATVDRALDELGECELLEAPAAGGSTRREATLRLARMGAAAATAPLILSVAAQPAWAVPTLAQCLALSNNCGGSGSNGCKTAGCCCCQPTDPPLQKKCVDVASNCPVVRPPNPGYNTCA